MKPDDLKELAGLLRQRLATIGDTELRERDPGRQLALLREVSEAIESFHRRHREGMPARLNHFLGNCSFDKALAWTDEALPDGEAD